MKFDIDNYKKDTLLRQCFEYNQAEISPMIVKYLQKNKKNVQIIDRNIVSLNSPDKPIFSAHLDIVGNDFSKPIKFKNDILYRENAILGGDDRAGVYAILKNVNSIDNIIFTVDEEVGVVGSMALMQNNEFIDSLANFPCCIVLDRKGNSDIISIHNDYCDMDLVEDIIEILPSYNIGVGTFSDADSFAAEIPCVNLSVGYYNAHTKNEFLNLYDLHYIVNKLPELNQLSSNYGLAETHEFYDYDYSGDSCVFCNKFTTGEFGINGKSVCFDCMTELFYQGDFF